VFLEYLAQEGGKSLFDGGVLICQAFFGYFFDDCKKVTNLKRETPKNRSI
jgi:hypothetical protein